MRIIHGLHLRVARISQRRSSSLYSSTISLEFVMDYQGNFDLLSSCEDKFDFKLLAINILLLI